MKYLGNNRSSLTPEEIAALKKSDERNAERRRKADKIAAEATEESRNEIYSHYAGGKKSKKKGK